MIKRSAHSVQDSEPSPGQQRAASEVDLASAEKQLEKKGAGGGKKPPAQKSPLDKAMSEAQRVKTTYCKPTAAAQNL
eukprot:15228975-Alexandrium_andersonii.AAC.1